MEHHLKNNKNKQLPIVYPLVLYSGKRPYSCPQDLFDLFGEKHKLARKIFGQPYKLLDLHTIPDKELKEHLWFGVMARMMKHIYSKDILPYFKTIVSDLKHIEKTGEWDYIYKIISYLFEAGEVKNKDDFVDILKDGLTSNEDKIMTIADQFRAEGRAEGEARGVEKVTKKLLQSGMGIPQVSNLTGLPVDKLQAMQAKIKK